MNAMAEFLIIFVEIVEVIVRLAVVVLEFVEVIEVVVFSRLAEDYGVEYIYDQHGG
jgi:hypothetical protein